MAISGVSDNLLGVLLRNAPGVANAVLGPIGGSVVSMLAGSFGLSHSSDKPVDAVALEQRIANDPDADVKLKQLALSLAELEVKRDDINLQNLTSARSNNVQAPHGWVVPICAVGYGGIFSVLLLLDALHLVDISDRYIQDLYTIALIIVNYYFGSSFKRG